MQEWGGPVAEHFEAGEEKEAQEHQDKQKIIHLPSRVVSDSGYGVLELRDDGFIRVQGSGEQAGLQKIVHPFPQACERGSEKGSKRE